MKILTVRSTLPDMGPGTQPLTIARHMLTKGHHTVFATSGGPYTPVVQEAGFKVEIVPDLAHDRHGPASVVKGVSHLASIIRSERPDVIHGHNAAATIYGYLGGLMAGSRVPCVTSVRGVEERETHQWRNQIWKRVPGMLLGVCEKTRDRLLSFGVPREKIVVTYNGIDLDRFSPAAEGRDANRAELGLTGKIVIGTTGAMTGPEHLDGPGKGQHHVVEAAAKLRDRFPNLAVLLVGDGPARAKVEAVVDRLSMRSHVTFTGMRFDVPKMLSAMDIYCLPSIHGEFFPNSIIEAMSMKLPWVGSDIAGLSELTAQGEAGWVSAPGDVNALADNLAKLAADPQLMKVRGETGRREVEERFTIEKVTDRILEGYRAAGFSDVRT